MGSISETVSSSTIVEEAKSAESDQSFTGFLKVVEVGPGLNNFVKVARRLWVTSKCTEIHKKKCHKDTIK